MRTEFGPIPMFTDQFCDLHNPNAMNLVISWLVIQCSTLRFVTLVPKHAAVILTPHKTHTMSSLHIPPLKSFNYKCCLLRCKAASLWSADCEAPRTQSLSFRQLICTCSSHALFNGIACRPGLRYHLSLSLYSVYGGISKRIYS